MLLVKSPGDGGHLKKTTIGGRLSREGFSPLKLHEAYLDATIITISRHEPYLAEAAS